MLHVVDAYEMNRLTQFRGPGIRPWQMLTTIGTVLTAAVDSKEPEMVQEVVECVRKYITDE